MDCAVCFGEGTHRDSSWAAHLWAPAMGPSGAFAGRLVRGRPGWSRGPAVTRISSLPSRLRPTDRAQRGTREHLVQPQMRLLTWVRGTVFSNAFMAEPGREPRRHGQGCALSPPVSRASLYPWVAVLLGAFFPRKDYLTGII